MGPDLPSLLRVAGRPLHTSAPRRDGVHQRGEPAILQRSPVLRVPVREHPPVPRQPVSDPVLPLRRARAAGRDCHAGVAVLPWAHFDHSHYLHLLPVAAVGDVLHQRACRCCRGTLHYLPGRGVSGRWQSQCRPEVLPRAPQGFEE